MDWKILGSTFVLIFLAELGDKTQIAVMAKTAGERSMLAVLIGACLALIVSTILAVIVGSFLNKYLDPRVVRGAAGLIFLAFGAIWVLQAVKRPVPEAEPAPAKEAVKPGFLTRVVLDAAVEFEKASSVNFLDFAATATDKALRDIFTQLAYEDRCHLGQLRALGDEHGETTLKLPTMAVPVANVPELPEKDREAVALAVEHERAAAKFYAELAKSAPVASLRSAFQQLAFEEQKHAQRLESWVTRRAAEST